MSLVRSLVVLLVSVVSLSVAAAGAATTQPAARPIRVALYQDVGASPNKLVELLGKQPGIQVTRVTAEQIRSGALDGVDVLIHPGGSGGKQGNNLAEAGRERVRAFVRRGGGYIGICAGAYLATCDYTWSLHILDAKVIDKQHWARGNDPVDVAISDEGRKLLAAPSGTCSILYFQGPLLAPAGNPELADYQALGTFDGEVAKNGAPKGVMKGTTAIACAPFGDGRVMCFSPHPEKTAGLEGFITRAISWVAKR
jgi:putative intracellular protease/amidase